MGRASTDPITAPPFHEVQPYPPLSRCTRLLLGLGGATIFAALSAWHILREGEMQPEMVIPLLLFLLFMILFFWSERYERQETVLEGRTLRLRHFTFGRGGTPKRTIALDQIESLSVVSCAPIVDGPWTAQAHEAIRILLKNGDEIRLGTERPEELMAALEAAGAPAPRVA